MSGCISILPWIETVYPGLLMNSIILSFSTSAIVSAPLVADYVVPSNHGKAIAILGLGACFGNITSVFVLLSITKYIDSKLAYCLVGSLFMIFSFYMFFTIKEVKNEDETLDTLSKKKSS